MRTNGRERVSERLNSSVYTEQCQPFGIGSSLSFCKRLLYDRAFRLNEPEHRQRAKMIPIFKLAVAVAHSVSRLFLYAFNFYVQ